jgi:hypothetical protein
MAMKDYKDMTAQEREAFMEAMTECDRRRDYYKTHGRPLTAREKMLEYEKKRTVIHY